MAAVVEGMLDEERLLTEQVIATLPPRAMRLDEVFERFNMMGGRDVQLGFFEVLGKIVRHEELQKQAGELYSEGRDLFTRVLGGNHDPELSEALRPLAKSPSPSWTG